MVSNDGGAHDVFIVIGATLPNYHDIAIVMVRSQTSHIRASHKLLTYSAGQMSFPFVPFHEVRAQMLPIPRYRPESHALSRHRRSLHTHAADPSRCTISCAEIPKWP
jgi:hypothetical protein